MDEWNTDCAPLWMPYDMVIELTCHFSHKPSLDMAMWYQYVAWNSRTRLVSLGCHFKPLNAIHDFVRLTLVPFCKLTPWTLAATSAPWFGMSGNDTLCDPNWSQNSFTKPIRAVHWQIELLVSMLMLIHNSQVNSWIARRQGRLHSESHVAHRWLLRWTLPLARRWHRWCHSARRSSSFGTAKRTWRGRH